MNHLHFKQLTSLADIDKLRNDHLSTAFESQELYLELKIREASVYKILNKEKSIGYFLTDHHQKTLLEFYLSRPFLYLARSPYIKNYQGV